MQVGFKTGFEAVNPLICRRQLFSHCTCLLLHDTEAFGDLDDGNGGDEMMGL